MRKKKVAILGGAFDPITEAHVRVAEFVLKNSNFKEVWFMPSFKNPNKNNMTSHVHRVEMCRLALEGREDMKLCTYEIDNQLSGETINVFKRLTQEKEYEDHSFSMIIGMDQANNLESWVDYDELKKTVSFVVVPRKGYRKKPSVNWFTKRPHAYLKGKTDGLLEVSSTEMRFAARVIQGPNSSQVYEDSASKNLHSRVLEYIKENGLYE